MLLDCSVLLNNEINPIFQIKNGENIQGLWRILETRYFWFVLLGLRETYVEQQDRQQLRSLKTYNHLLSLAS